MMTTSRPPEEQERGPVSPEMSHRGGLGPQWRPLWTPNLPPVGLPSLALLSVAANPTGGAEGEGGAGCVKQGGDEAEERHGCVAAANVAGHPGVAVTGVEPLAPLAHLRAVDANDEVQVEAHRRHIGHRPHRLEHQRPPQEPG